MCNSHATLADNVLGVSGTVYSNVVLIDGPPKVGKYFEYLHCLISRLFPLVVQKLCLI